LASKYECAQTDGWTEMQVKQYIRSLGGYNKDILIRFMLLF